ncbi:MAG: phosphoenolpyruvate carboxykinase (ATP) [Gemmataceae bacterium]|nr:phosphoenolpyruvate carboxykinase (ATP) [Gemmataceae bacterium]
MNLESERILAATPPFDATVLEIPQPGQVFAHLTSAVLVEHAVRRREGVLTENGAFSAYTGPRTGRSPKDKYIVRDSWTAASVDWSANQSMEPELFNRLLERFRQHFRGRDLYVFDGYAGADPRYRLRLRVVTEKAWHSLFARALFLRPAREELQGFTPDWTVWHAADFHADPVRDGTRSDACIVLNFEQRRVLVGGTHYAGEIKKAIFTVLNFLLPEQGVFPMHCAANVGGNGDVALFFGLSGTGKTTLSADGTRRLIGDDEHGWSDQGIFNFEGGCYAKTIHLSADGEPQIWNALRFGSVLENIPVDPYSRQPDFSDERITENTRAAYPLHYIPHYEPSGQGSHPRHIIFLTCDAFGVLPPLARLDPEQAIRYFLCGYTAKVAGTETGVHEPTPEFSTCFAQPFLPRSPQVYAQMLRQRLEQHRPAVWLLNTGWSGGPFGTGQRIPLTWTRKMLAAALQGDLDAVTYETEPHFGLAVPRECPGVPSWLFRPRDTWSDPAAYDKAAASLAARFVAEERRFRF